jgi:hypothetical protein
MPFQVPFVRAMKLRSKVEHAGRLFQGPDGGVLNFEGRALHSSSGHGIGYSPLEID